MNTFPFTEDDIIAMLAIVPDLDPDNYVDDRAKAIIYRTRALRTDIEEKGDRRVSLQFVRTR